MITYENFSLEWKSDGDDLLQNVMFKYCTIDFIHRSIPKVAIKVGTNNPEKLVVATDTEVTIVLDNNTTLSFHFFVFQRSIEGDEITLTGYACRSDFMKTTKSSYLGSSLDSALGKVCDDFKVNFTTSVSGEFFQINETDCQCLLRLLKGCSDSKSFEFTNDSIELIDDTEEFKLPNGIRMGIDFNFVTENDSEPVIETDEDFYNQGWNKKQVYESSSEGYIRNVLSTIKYERAYDILVTERYQGVPSGFVGGKVKIQFSDLTFTEWTMIGKIITVSSNNGVTTDVILGANK